MLKDPKQSMHPATIADAKIMRAEGGETHQIAGGDVPILTTAPGIPISDDQNSLKIGPRGPTLLEDFILREKIFNTSITSASRNEWFTPAASAAHGVFQVFDASHRRVLPRQRSSHRSLG